MVDDGVVGREHAVGEPVVAHELPDVLDRVELGAFGRQRDERDVGRHGKAAGEVPSGLVEQQRAVRPGVTRADISARCRPIASVLHQGRTRPAALPSLGADRAEDVGRRGALVLRRGWPLAAPGPAPGDLVLLADAGFVGEPDFYGIAPEALCARDRVQAGGETFLKASIAPSACAWWRGRADSLRYPIARSSRLSVCLATLTWNSSHSHWQRSTIRQRTTPCTAGIGPLSITPAKAARCVSLSREGWPGALDGRSGRRGHWR